jgi:Domain of Unknown Function (DUF1080)
MKLPSFLLVLLASVAFAAEPVKLTLDDFTSPDGNKPEPGWSTEEGGIIKLTPAKGTSFVLSKKEYTNFVLEWDWKLADAGNNGIKYWVTKVGGKEWLGIEYQMIDDQKNPDGKRGGNHDTGSLYDLIDSDKGKILNPIGQWNHSKVVVKDGKIEHYLNGKLCASVDTSTPVWKAALAKSKFAKKEGFAPGKGKLMLTEHHDPCWFKDLTITEL